VRKILTYLILLGVVLWIVLSYVPGLALPVISFPAAFNPLFRTLLAVTTMIFLGLQAWLVWTTVKTIQSGQQREGSVTQEFGLSLAREAFWTALPIAMTIGLALISYQTWASLASP